MVFETLYPAGTEYKQDFMLCANTTHATYMKHGFAFRDTMMSQSEISNANKANVRLGYNFHVTEVAVFNSTRQGNTVDIKVVIQQVGIAPFYYPLAVSLSCKGLSTPLSVTGVEKLIERNQFEYYTFLDIPATIDCLSQISVSLNSTWLYTDNPIKFAQGSTGLVTFSVPLPSNPMKSLFLRTSAPTAVPIDTVNVEEQQYYVNIVLVDATTDTDIGPLYSDDTNNIEFQTESIDLSQVGRALSIRAMVNNATRVSFKWYESNKPTLWIESTAPYAMGGDVKGNYTPVRYLSTPGVKAIRVVAQDSTGKIFAERSISFTMIDSNATNVSSSVVVVSPSIPSALTKPTAPTTPATVTTVITVAATPMSSPGYVPVSFPISISIPISVVPGVPTPTTLSAPAGPQLAPIFTRTQGRTHMPTIAPVISSEQSSIEFYLVNTKIDWDLSEIKQSSIFLSSDKTIGTLLSVYADIKTSSDVAYTILEFMNDVDL